MKKVKEGIINVLKALGGIALTALAICLFPAVALPALVWLIVACVDNDEKKKARDFLTGIKDFFVGLAKSFDQTGNISFSGFFNWLFLTADATYFFGDPVDTISFVLGWNQKTGTLSRSGKILVFVLDKMDKKHCDRALESGIEKAEQKIKKYNNLKFPS